MAMVATTVETANPEAEIQPGLNLLGPIKQKFLQVSDYSGGSSGIAVVQVILPVVVQVLSYYGERATSK